MMNVEELKLNSDYEFECNMSDEYKDIETDEWGCAFVWVDIWIETIGVEYNFCIDGGKNCSAIYKMKYDEEKEYNVTDYDTFIHYEINFDNENWKEELEEAMCKALIELHNL